MLPASGVDISVLLSQVQAGFFFSGIFNPPQNQPEAYVQILLRTLHFIAGIIWIGHLYFFNLVSGNLMKSLDGPTKGKVIPQLMPRALWWFRWGALITVLVGLMYYAMYIVQGDAERAGKNVWMVVLVWLLIPVVTFGIEMLIVKKIDNGWVLALLIAVLVMIMALVILWWLKSQLAGNGSNKSYSIGIGGALGLVMLFNVWGIIWPNQKRIISWTADNAENGTAIPAESAKLGRVAFLASRTNTWLSVPMLLLMGASSHFTMFGV
jgi:uncharacterized membrane protein